MRKVSYDEVLGYSGEYTPEGLILELKGAIQGFKMVTVVDIAESARTRDGDVLVSVEYELPLDPNTTKKLVLCRNDLVPSGRYSIYKKETGGRGEL